MARRGFRSRPSALDHLILLCSAVIERINLNVMIGFDTWGAGRLRKENENAYQDDCKSCYWRLSCRSC